MTRAGRSQDPALPPAAAAFARSVAPRYAPDTCIEPVHLELSLSVDIGGRRVEARARWTVVGRQAGATTLTFQAMDLDVHSVSDPSGGALSHRLGAQDLVMTWAAPFAAGERREVEITWTVVSPLTGMLFSPPGGPAWMATDHEPERARYWLPCLDHPAVRTSLDLHIRSEAHHTILANGARQGTTLHEDGTKTVHWQLRGAGCPSYLLCLAVGEFQSEDLGQAGPVPLAAFAPAPYTPELLRRCFGPTGAMMDWMTRRLGAEFPFPKYFQFSVPQINGAMENISLVSWDDAFMQDERLHAEYGWVFDLINLHEMAHSWFGDAVVIADFAHVWLKESWATYLESVWLEETVGALEMQLQLYAERIEYRGEADARYHRPIVTRRYESAWDMFDRHLYPGGAVRLHLLRRIVGDEAFWAGTREFLRRFHGKTVETADFRRVMEEHSGRYLGQFFEQWFESPGYPALKVNTAWEAPRGALLLTVEQTQMDAKKGIGAFSFPLELALETGEGHWEHHTVQVTEGRAVFAFTGLAAEPLSVVLDPHMSLVYSARYEPGQPALERALRGPFLNGKLHAAETLVGNGRPRALAAVLAAWRAEPHWRVRANLATLVGKGTTAPAIEALVAMLAEETDPRAMFAVAEAAGKLRDPRLAAALVAFLETERPYRAAGAALKSLGAQRLPAHLPLLERFADAPSWWGHVQRGALQGIGGLRTLAATESLLARLEQPLPQVRSIAVEALAEAGAAQSPPVVDRVAERIIDLLRDPSYNVRMAAARALGTLGRPQDAAALRGLLPNLATQDHPRVSRIAARLSTGGDDGLRKEVEQLGDKLRAAEGRILALEARLRA